LGTQAENISDMVQRGRNRGARGEANSHAKLNESSVKEIRQKIADGIRRHEIAKEYGVSAALISMIRLGRIWRHVD
jgi:hypothetical protein